MMTDSEPTLEVAVLFPGFPGVLSHSALYEKPPLTFWFMDSIAFLKVKVIFLFVIEMVATSAPLAWSDCVAISVILTPSGASMVNVSPSLTDLPVKSQSNEKVTFCPFVWAFKLVTVGETVAALTGLITDKPKATTPMIATNATIFL